MSESELALKTLLPCSLLLQADELNQTVRTDVSFIHRRLALWPSFCCTCGQRHHPAHSHTPPAKCAAYGWGHLIL